MLDKIRDFINRQNQNNAGSQPANPVDKGDLRLASAVVILEVAITDSRLEPVEQQRILNIIQRLYHCSEQEAMQLLQTAEAQSEDRDHFYTFAKTVKEKMPYEQRVMLIEMMWEVAFSDGELHNFEENIIRRAAGLLYVTDKDRAEARQRVQSRL